jgi:clan AA aspartic protease
MGTFSVSIEVGDPPAQRWTPMQALVDSGSTYTWVPSDALQALGVVPQGRREFETAGDEVIEREIGETRVRLNGEVLTTIVVFAGGGSAPLLGAVTLEQFSLAVDPVHRRLVPVRALAMHLGT